MMDSCIFCSWFGEKNFVNSKVLFEYVNNNDKNIKPNWLTNNRKVYNELQSKGYRVYFSYSIFGYLSKDRERYYDYDKATMGLNVKIGMK
jgi:hypothetical protein